MNALLLFASLLVGDTYHAEDFHYYDNNLQTRGLPLVNKIYVEVSEKDKKDFVALMEKFKVEQFKEFENNDLRGYLVFVKNKQEVIDRINALNEKGFSAHPVVVFDGIECTTDGDINVVVRPSVNLGDYTKRLNSLADGKFTVSLLRPRIYKIKVEKLNNPSNVIILANLLAKDSVWVDYAIISWTPLEGYVKANVSVETAANGQLGELRTLKLTVDVFEPDIKVRTDMFPQLGQGFVPFPFAGEIWFDPSPPRISELRTVQGKQIVAEYAFRQLQFGSFAFQPIVISYERKGQLQTVKSNACQYAIRSVIAGTDIDDIQPRPTDNLSLSVQRPVDVKRDDAKLVYWYMKAGISGVCFGFAALFIASALSSFKRSASNWFRTDDKEAPWRAMEACRGSGKPYYEAIASYVNRILNIYGTSLYAVDLSKCTHHFRMLVGELDNLYRVKPFWDHEKLRCFVKQFYKDRKYK